MSAPMANVRVKLLFPNPTENCWFLINTEADHIIGDVERRVLARFGGGDVCAGLFLDGCRLPTEESTLVLRDNDNINIRFTGSGPDSVATHHKEPFIRSPSLDLPKCHKKKHKSEHKKRKHKSDDHEEPEHKESEHKKKRQHSKEKEDDNEQKNKKKKKRHSNAANQESEPVEASPKKDKAMMVQRSNDEKETTEVSKESNENIPEDISEASKAKRKRRSRRKRKTSTKTAIVVTELCATPFAAVTKPKPTVTFSSNWLPTNRKQDEKKHMFFDSDQETSGTSEATIKPTEEANPSKPFQPEPSAIQQRLSAVAMGVVSSTAQSDVVDPVPTTPTDNSKERSEPTETVMDIEVRNGDNMQEDNAEDVGISPEDSKGYTVVPPPGDYRPKYQQNRSSRRNNNSPASLLQGAQVFNRRRCKKNAFHPLSKEEQLNSMQTNKSTVFQNPTGDNQNGDVEKPQEPKEPPKDYASMEQLHGLPREKDRIAFKTLELSEDCSPEMSDFQEAVVLRYDPVTKMVDLEMFPVKGVRKPSRFDLVVEDETEILTNVADDNLKSLSWSSLVDVRLVPLT